MKLSEVAKQPSFVILLIQLVLAYEWLHGGWEKLYGGAFVGGMAKTLARFGEGNPHVWYVNSFLQMAKNNPALFGQLVQWGELCVGLGLVVGVAWYLVFSQKQVARRPVALAMSLALLGGLWLNANFYFAAGWTSPSTSGLNVLMFWVQMCLLLFWVTSCSKNLSKSGSI